VHAHTGATSRRGIGFVPFSPLGEGSLTGENLAAADLALTARDLRDLDEAARAIPVQGARHPAALQRPSGR
jgi:hypothetical protein